MTKPKRYLVTAALPYANGPLHIGHLAGCYLPSDIYVRYLRSEGEDVKFICGSDEHGVPITLKARKEGVSPMDIVNKYHKMMGDSFKEFGIHFDIYSRTSSPTHHQTASNFFKKLYEKGCFTELETDQYFDPVANQFLADRYIVGTCPRCQNPDAYGDQCEKCGSSLSPMELISPKSTLSGATPILKKTKNWFLPLDKLSPKLKDYVEQHKDWKPNVFGQCKSWLESGDGLQPRAMTRDLNWGVKVPVNDAEGKVLYVWFDAPIGYISATKELLPDQWKSYWQDPECELIHFIGKDNIVFHCLIFPAMLMEHGEFILPSYVPANEFLNLEGKKISTSRNWAVWLHEYLDDFKDMQDVLRYTLCANAPESKDNDFTWKDLQARNNNELVAIFGNFVNRTLVLTHKFYDGCVPESLEFTKEDLFLLEEIKTTPARIAKDLAQFRFRDALHNLMNLARAGNKYLAENEPWKLIKSNETRVRTVMNIALQITANLAVLCEPFLPFTSNRLLKMLNLPKLKWKAANQCQNLPDGHKINKEELLFRKIEDQEIDAMVEKLHRMSMPNLSSENKENLPALAPLKSLITFQDFEKMDIRTGTVIHAEKVEGTDKLLKLQIDLGFEVRTIVSGISKFYSPEDITGKVVTVLANLTPRKIKGIESSGMILMAENDKGELSLVSRVNSSAGNGSRVQ